MNVVAHADAERVTDIEAYLRRGREGAVVTWLGTIDSGTRIVFRDIDACWLPDGDALIMGGDIFGIVLSDAEIKGEN